MVTIESGTMISLPGTVYQLFSLLWKNNINVKFISQSSSENNITFEDVIFYVQSILNIGYINRDMSLYAFYTQYKEATKKIKQNG